MKRFTLFFALVLAFTFVKAQNPGALDPTFGTNGISQIQIGDDAFLVDELHGIEIQDDGKTIAFGSSRDGGQKRMAIVRFNEDGTLDASFGNNGIVLIIPSSAYGNFIMDVEVMPDGKLIACGRIYHSDGTEPSSLPVLVKLNSDGSTDSSFGNNGLVIGNFDVDVLPEAMVVQNDGKIVLGGYYDDQMMTMRYNEDGTLDTSYGRNGFCILTEEMTQSINSYVKAIDIQDDGKTIIVGMCYVNDLPKWGVARINTNGTLDTSFGRNGLTIMSPGYGNDFATTVLIQDDGKILVGGNSWDANEPVLKYSFAIGRLNNDGSIDGSFANSGLYRYRLLDEGENYITKLAISPSDEIYASFSIRYEPQSIYDMGILCLDMNGIPCENFGENGYSVIDIGGTDSSMDLGIQPDGKIVLGGECFSPTGDGARFTVARFMPNSSTPVFKAPNNLFAEIEDSEVTLTWPYEAPAGPVNDWIYYDDGTYKNSLGMSGLPLYWGIIFPSSTMNAYDGASLTKIKIFDVEAGACTMSIYYGGETAPGVLVHSQNFSFSGSNNWLEIDLTSVLAIDPSQNLWITFYTENIANPAAASLYNGDTHSAMFSGDGNIWYDLFSATGGVMSGSFMVRAFVTNQAKGGETEVSAPMAKASLAIEPISYKIYRSTSNSNYEVIATIDAEELPMTYVDDLSGMALGTYYYQVTALYEYEGEMHESEPANAYGSNDNYVTVIYNHDGLSDSNITVASIYPNPAKNYINVSANGMQQISVINILGQVVFAKNAETDSETIDMSQFESGIYMIRVESKEGTSAQRISVVK